MSYKFLFRVECLADGKRKGAYVSDLAYTYDNHKAYGEASCFDLCPSPSDGPTALLDVIRSDMGKYYFFAFESMEQLNGVFPCYKGRDAMRDKGAVISIYKVDESLIIKGDDQVIFRKDLADLVLELPANCR